MVDNRSRKSEVVAIHWHDTLLEIPKWIIERYNKENINLDDKYLDELYSYHRPPMLSFQTEPEYSHVFTRLMIANLNGIRAKKSLGKFVMYGSDGSKIATFDSLYKIVLNENYRCNCLGYESSDKENIFPEKVAKQRQLRGLTVVEPTEKAGIMLRELNDYKRNMFAWFYGVRAQKSFHDEHRSPLLNDYTFEEFRKQHCKAISMEFYWALAASIRYFDSNNQDKAKRQEMPLTPYNAALTRLQKRYTFKKKALLKKVTNLDDYTNFAGIYILCLSGVRGYYVGQTAHSLSKRIRQHWRKPGTDFDRKYSESDVAEIYVMPLDIPAVYEQFGLDAIERDCIASVPKKYLLNSMVGGGTILWVKNKKYKQADYRLPTDVLNDLKDRILFFQEEHDLV